MILDTNALSAMADGDPALEAALWKARQLFLPVIVLGEYRYGIAQSRHRSRYEAWLEQLQENCRILRVDERTALEYAGIRGEQKRNGKPVPANDAWIAALARQHGQPVLTQDAHFGSIARVETVSW